MMRKKVVNFTEKNLRGDLYIFFHDFARLAVWMLKEMATLLLR